MSSIRENPDFIDAFLKWTFNTEPADNFRLWTAISTIAGLLQRRCFITWEGPLFPNFYITLAGPAGSRKGTAMRFGRIILNAAGVPIAPESTTREALIRDIAESYVSTPTGTDIIHHASLTVYADELAVFLNQKDTRIIRDLNNWFDCPDIWRYKTKDAKLSDEISHVWVNICGATTPQLIDAIMPYEVLVGGLSSRMIFVFAQRKGKIVPIPMKTPEEIALEESLINDAHTILQMIGEFKISQEFLEKNEKWTYIHEANPPFVGTILEGYADRRRIHLLKLAMICSVSRGQTMQLTVKDFDRALSILELTEKDMLGPFTGYGRSDMASITADMIRFLATEKKVLLSRILEMYYKDTGDKEMTLKILSTIKGMKKIKWENQDDGDLLITYIMKGE